MQIEAGGVVLVAFVGVILHNLGNLRADHEHTQQGEDEQFVGSTLTPRTTFVGIR